MLSQDNPYIFRLSLEGRIYDSGVLLLGGQYVLTAAHLFTNHPQASDVKLTNSQGQLVTTVSSITIHPNWDNDPSSYNHDLAIIKLAQPLASHLGYEIYRGHNEIGQTFTRIGYSGTELIKGENTYDAYSDMINPLYGSHIETGTQLLYDYDDGTAQHDALGLLFNLNNLGLGALESMSQAGLSGAPTFINNQIAGIGSFIFRYSGSDVDGVTNSSVGEMGSDMRISAEADWIDYVTQGNPVYTPPTMKADVMTNVPEPNYGNVINYFLATFGEPLKQAISFDYQTRDGSAVAGQDYVATQGHCTLQAGQDHIAIPVTILGDKFVEGDETVELEVSNPEGFSFPNGALTLIAIHTIVDNDTLI